MTTMDAIDEIPMSSLEDYHPQYARDLSIRYAVARATAPGLLDYIESGQPLINPEGVYCGIRCSYMTGLLSIIDDYRAAMHRDGNTAERDRAIRALACGHGGSILRSCAQCDAGEPALPDAAPVIVVAA